MMKVFILDRLMVSIDKDKGNYTNITRYIKKVSGNKIIYMVKVCLLTVMETNIKDNGIKVSGMDRVNSLSQMDKCMKEIM